MGRRRRIRPSLAALLRQDRLEVVNSLARPSLAQLEKPERQARAIEQRARPETRSEVTGSSNVGTAVVVPALSGIQPAERAQGEAFIGALACLSSQPDRLVEHVAGSPPPPAFEFEVA